MAKNSAVKKQKKYEDDFDFSEMVDYHGEEEAMFSMMNGLLEASRHQLEMTMELTKIIVEKNPNSSMKESDILSTFQRASQAVALNSPVRELWEKMNA